MKIEINYMNFAYFIKMMLLCLLGTPLKAQTTVTYDSLGKISIDPLNDASKMICSYKISEKAFRDELKACTQKAAKEPIDTKGLKELYGLLNNDFKAAIANFEDTNKVMHFYFKYLLGENTFNTMLSDYQYLYKVTKYMNISYDNKNVNLMELKKILPIIKELNAITPASLLGSKTLETSLEKKFDESIIYKKTLKAEFLRKYNERLTNIDKNFYSIEQVEASSDSLIRLTKRIDSVKLKFDKLIEKLKTSLNKLTFEFTEAQIKKVTDYNTLLAYCNTEWKQKVGNVIVAKSDCPPNAHLVFSIDSIQQFITLIHNSTFYKDSILAIEKRNLNNYFWLSNKRFLNPFVESTANMREDDKIKLVEKFINYKLKDSTNYHKLSVADYKSLVADLDKVAEDYTKTSSSLIPYLTDTIILNKLKYPKLEEETMNILFISIMRNGAKKIIGMIY